MLAHWHTQKDAMHQDRFRHCHPVKSAGNKEWTPRTARTAAGIFLVLARLDVGKAVYANAKGKSVASALRLHGIVSIRWLRRHIAAAGAHISNLNV